MPVTRSGSGSPRIREAQTDRHAVDAHQVAALDDRAQAIVVAEGDDLGDVDRNVLGRAARTR